MFKCPAGDWSCPYWKESNICGMEDEGLNPVEECDECEAFMYDGGYEEEE